MRSPVGSTTIYHDILRIHLDDAGPDNPAAQEIQPMNGRPRRAGLKADQMVVVDPADDKSIVENRVEKGMLGDAEAGRDVPNFRFEIIARDQIPAIRGQPEFRVVRGNAESRRSQPRVDSGRQRRFLEPNGRRRRGSRSAWGRRRFQRSRRECRSQGTRQELPPIHRFHDGLLRSRVAEA